MRVVSDHLLLVRPLVHEGLDVVVGPEGLDGLEQRRSMHFLSNVLSVLCEELHLKKHIFSHRVTKPRWFDTSR